MKLELTEKHVDLHSAKHSTKGICKNKESKQAAILNKCWFPLRPTQIWYKYYSNKVIAYMYIVIVSHELHVL